MKPINYEQMLAQCQSNSRTFQHLQEKVRMTNQQVIQKINPKKIELYFSRKFDTKEKEIVNQICLQFKEKLDAVLERQTNKLLNDWKANENLKMVDYIYERNSILEKIGENPYSWYDQEEEYLNSLCDFLKEYYKKI